MTTNPNKVKITFEDPSDGNLVMITLDDLLNGYHPVNEDGIPMEFVECVLE